MRVVLIGPKGVGKSTQAQRLGAALPDHNHSPRISTGELIAAQVEAGTDLGREMTGFFERGERIPDELVLPLVFARLSPAGGWVLDDFPANVAQARALDAQLDARIAGSGGISRVISLEGLDDEALISRVTGGRVRSRATGRTYHLKHEPPPKPEDRTDPGPFERRDDDVEETLVRRMEEFRREIGPLKEHYEKQSLLSVVDANQSAEEVTRDILAALGNPERREYYIA